MLEYGQKLWVNGALSDFSDAGKVSILLHSLHYGVGVFEGIRSYRCHDGCSKIFRLREHVERLHDSCKLMGIAHGYDVDTLSQACVQVLRENRFDEAYLRPLVLLGEGSMGLGLQGNAPQTFILAWKWGAYLGAHGVTSGIRCKTSAWRRAEPGSGFPRGKIVGQYVTNVMAKNDALRDGYDEALMTDSNGYVLEGTGENLFVVRRGRLLTPPLSSSILPGITRSTVISLAEDAGYVVEERMLARDDVYLADEVFLTGTAAEVTPVVEVDGRSIGSGEVGELSSRLQKCYFEVVRGGDASHSQWLTDV